MHAAHFIYLSKHLFLIGKFLLKAPEGCTVHPGVLVHTESESPRTKAEPDKNILETKIS